MELLENQIKTMIVNSDDGAKNFEIIREVSGNGIQGTKKAMLVTICPSTSALGELKLDSTATHLINHLNELNISQFSIVNLFSNITQSRMSCRGLTIDTENMEYIESKMKRANLLTNKTTIG